MIDYDDKGNVVHKAINFASRKHFSQEDDEGKDYFLAHIQPVAQAVSMFTNDDDVVATAYLHDILEDTDTTPEELRKEFGERITNLVIELTHKGSPDEKGYYFPSLKSKEAIMIKLIDRASNISRMNAWSEGRKYHYLEHSKFWRD
jgi:(p)ppGpp synthase/HD superfamily hydrolase